VPHKDDVGKRPMAISFIAFMPSHDLPEYKGREGTVPVVYFDPNETWDHVRFSKAKRVYNEFVIARGGRPVDFLIKNIGFPEKVSESETMKIPLFCLQLLRATITCEPVLEHKYVGPYRDSVVSDLVQNKCRLSPFQQKDLVEVASSLPGKWEIVKAEDGLDLSPEEVSKFASALTKTSSEVALKSPSAEEKPAP